MVEISVASAAQASTRGDAPGNGAPDDLIIERHGINGTVSCRWNISNFSSKQKVLYSKYFEVGGYDCRLLVYPSGDAQALPGYMSLYLQISDPGTNSSKWDCFASYQLAVRNLADDSKSVKRDSWHRFSAKKRSHGWCDFAALSVLSDPKTGFLGPEGTIQVSTDITILDESVSFTRENDLGGSAPLSSSDVYSGKFVWKVQNFSVFQPLLKTQKIMSPAFPAGECALRMSVYQSTVNGVDYLSLCLESKDTERTGPPDRTCWCLFRLAVQPQTEGGRTVYRDSYGRFASDNKSGDNTSLGWNDFMKMEEFLAPAALYLEGDTAVFSTSFHVIRESTSLVRHLEPRGAAAGNALIRARDKRKSAARESDYAGRFQWRLENFTRLKDLLKKRKITGLCIKSKRFTIGGRDCRLIIYPRGQSQPPTFLSVFLEVTDPQPPSPDWTCFVSHRLSVVNQRGDGERSVAKESQNRYSKSAKDWGWREFVSLTTLFDADAGFLVNDSVVFSAEVLVLKEIFELKKLRVSPLMPAGGANGAGEGSSGDLALTDGTPAVSSAEKDSSDSTSTALVPAGSESSAAEPAEPPSKNRFTWRIENFLAFKDVVEARKIFSKYFSAGSCDVRVGLYESFDSLCVYLESDAAATPPVAPAANNNAADGSAPAPEKPASYWVRYRAAILNQKAPEKTQWRDGSVYTRSWNNSVLQFPRIGGPGSQGGDHGGLLMRESLVVVVEILECKPWTQEAEAAAAGSAAAAPLTPPGPGQRGTAEGGSSEATGTAGGAVVPSGAAVPGRASHRAGDSDSLGTGGVNGDGADVDHDADDDSSGSLDTDEDDELTDDEDPHGDAEVEDALSRWLSAAGLELLGIDNHPPLVGEVESVQSTLEDMLHSQPGAIPMFVASLRMYMSSLPRVKRLLLPCLSTAPKNSGAIYGVAPAVISILAGLPSMRQPLINMLVDVMLDHTLTAKMHKHLSGEINAAELSSTSEDETEGSRSSDGAVENGNGTADTGDGHAPYTPPVSPAKAAAAAYSPALSPADGAKSARISGSLADAPPDEVEQTLGLILGWMASIDPSLLPAQQGASVADAHSAPSSAPLSPLHKVSMLLADAPPALQPDIVALVPRLVSPQEHTAAAGALLGRLAEASREGPEAEAALRLPVLAALGELQIDPGVAQKVLQAALEALPNLSASELSPAIGLVLKLASSNTDSCKAAVSAVRAKVHAIQDAAPSSGAIDALRLAVVQHPSVASAVLAAIKEDCQKAKTKTLPPSDAQVLLDCLALSALRNEAIAVVRECVKSGCLSSGILAQCLDERKQQEATSAPSSVEAVAAGPANGESKEEPEESTPSQEAEEASPSDDLTLSSSIDHSGPRVTSIAQRAFLAAHPLADDPGDRPMAACIASQLRLCFHGNTSPAGLPALATASASADELEGLVAASQVLMKSADAACKQFAGEMLLVAHRSFTDVASQRKVLKALAKIALSSGTEIAALVTNSSSGNGVVDGSAAAPALASSLLATLAAESPGGSSLVLSVALEMAAEAQEQAQHAQQAAAAAATRHTQELSAQRSALAKAETAQRRAEEQASELESTLARRTAEHAAELAGVASDRKELQAQLRSAEQQVEWVKSERDEEKSIRQRESREAAQRVAEAEAQVARLKVTRRDEQKKAQKDRGALADKLRELEDALERAETEVSRARNDSSLAASRLEKAAAEHRRRAEAAEHAVKQRDAEIVALRNSAAERDAHLRSAIDAQRTLEQHLAAERQRLSLFTSGVGIETLPPQELEALAGMLEAGLRRINTLLMQQGGGPAGPAARMTGPLHGSISPPSAKGQSSSSGGYRTQQGQGYGRPTMHGLGGHSSLDSMGSLQSSTDGNPGNNGSTSAPGGGGLFGADWGLGAGHAVQGAQDDSANMERLLGLLPSDLLHS